MGNKQGSINPYLWHPKHYNKQARSSERAQQKKQLHDNIAFLRTKYSITIPFSNFFNVMYEFYATELQQKNNLFWV